MAGHASPGRGRGARTEELRALTWAHVDLTGKPENDPPVPPSIQVWRSVRADGDAKTKKSRRTLALPARCVTALTTHHERQSRPAADRLVFPSAAGTALDRHNVLRAFRPVVAKSVYRVGLEYSVRLSEVRFCPSSSPAQPSCSWP